MDKIDLSKFKVGDKVRLTVQGMICPEVGTEGTVLSLDDHGKDAIEVEFPGWTHGHSGNSGSSIRNRRFFYRNGSAGIVELVSPPQQKFLIVADASWGLDSGNPKYFVGTLADAEQEAERLAIEGGYKDRLVYQVVSRAKHTEVETVVKTRGVVIERAA